MKLTIDGFVEVNGKKEKIPVTIELESPKETKSYTTMFLLFLSLTLNLIFIIYGGC